MGATKRRGQIILKRMLRRLRTNVMVVALVLLLIQVSVERKINLKVYAT